jgi:PAT family beta-lactamase induction signal transducer AmpG
MGFRFPDLLATKPGRMAAFFFLYMTEGIPLGFTATAIATQMRRQGLGPAEIGVFVGSLYLPWAFKWAAGPIVDILTVEQLGRRRFWIVLAQIGMIATLAFALPVDYVKELQLFTWIILVHNAFAATQDVAIDALAVSVLPEHERGIANGFMFGGAYAGQALGGSAVLFLSAHVPFRTTYLLVMGLIALVTVFIALPIREPRGVSLLASAADDVAVGRERGGAVDAFFREVFGAIVAVVRAIVAFVVQAGRSFVASRSAYVGVFFALLPAGAYALGLALQSNLAVELGLNDTQVGWLNLYSTIISATCCVLGGFLSDRFGRKPTLALFLGATVIPTLWLAYAMQQFGWIHSVPLDAPNRPTPAPGLVATFWATVLVYNVFQGLYYGIRSAQFMDITNPRVAATQFTAYMALMNLAINVSATWQGLAIERFGYPTTLVIDAAIGLPPLLLLLLMRPREQELADGTIREGRTILGPLPGWPMVWAAAAGAVAVVGWILWYVVASRGKDPLLSHAWTYVMVFLVVSGIVGSIAALLDPQRGQAPMPAPMPAPAHVAPATKPGLGPGAKPTLDPLDGGTDRSA